MRYIDGDALIKKLGIAYDCRECDKDKSPYCTWKPDVVDVCEAICDAPTIEPERKKGKWIFYETENERYDDIKCPFCKKTYTVDAYRIDDIGFTAEDFKFCPNCGSDMRGEQDE